MHNYLKRKNSEIALISKYLPNYVFKKINSFFELLIEKEKISKELKKYYAEKYYHELTNKDRIEIKKPFIYKYTYERFNGFIDIPNFANNFYYINKNIYTSNYFSNCGMSSICALLSSVISANEINVDLMYEETYFETIKYIFMIMKVESEKKILYIDSIASDFSFEDELNLNEYIGVIIDTTCFLGKNYKQMIEKIISLNKLCILVRSHTKLDLLGTEFAHIGSVSFIYPNELQETELFKKIEHDCKHLIGVMGACLPPERFPQFLLDKEIIKINQKRLKVVCNNNSYFYEQMKKNNINCFLPNHKQFCLINFENVSLNLEGLKKDIIKFCDHLRKKMPVFHAVSFGFDYISIDCYENFNDGKFKIRICINDMPLNYVNEFFIDFLKFYNRIEKPN